MKKNNEGSQLTDWMKENRYSAPDVARLLGVSRQAVYYQMEQEEVSETFKDRLMKAGLPVFGNLTNVQEPAAEYRSAPPSTDLGSTVHMVVTELIKLKDELSDAYKLVIAKQDEINNVRKEASDIQTLVIKATMLKDHPELRDRGKADEVEKPGIRQKVKSTIGSPQMGPAKDK